MCIRITSKRIYPCLDFVNKPACTHGEEPTELEVTRNDDNPFHLSFVVSPYTIRRLRATGQQVFIRVSRRDSIFAMPLRPTLGDQVSISLAAINQLARFRL
jgi:hypothetical protein